MVKKSTKKYIHAVGRRRESIARIRLYQGKGETLVNQKPIGEYFSGKIAETVYLKPFKVAGAEGKFYATIVASGGGLAGQLEAVVHGLSRALVKFDEKLKPALKDADLLTRDSRSRQRRMVGMGGKSRRKKQSPKR